MAEFDELWRKSHAFRKLFVGKERPFKKVEDVDKEQAQVLWDARVPEIYWDFCRFTGCNKLVLVGEYCSNHCYMTNMLPTWKWDYRTGLLYRFMQNKAVDLTHYVPYHIHVVQMEFGIFPKGYGVHYIDGNPFNLHKRNVIPMTKYSMLAMREGMMSFSDAVEIDQLVGKYVAGRTPGRRPMQMVIGYRDISRLTGVSPFQVRKSVERKKLILSDLSSVVKFVNEHKNSDNGMKPDEEEQR